MLNMSLNRLTSRLRPPSIEARGFSLIELTIVIVIMATLMAIAGPEVTGWIQNNRIRTIAENYLAGFQLARAEAIKSNNSASMELKARGAWDIKDAADTVTQTRGSGDGDTNVLTTITVPAGATLPYTVTFSGLGRLTTPAASMQIDFTSPATGTCIAAGGSVRCLRINVQVGGAARLCDPARPAGDPQSC
jgi:type IV fimbrial biogenesis protein FimT